MTSIDDCQPVIRADHSNLPTQNGHCTNILGEKKKNSHKDGIVSPIDGLLRFMSSFSTDFATLQECRTSKPDFAKY